MCPNEWPEGPIPKWETQGIKPSLSKLEIFMKPGDLRQDEGFKPINLYQRGETIGFEAGMDYEEGLPMFLHIEIDNGFEGLRDFVALELKSNLKLRLELDVLDDLLIPQFTTWELNNTEIIHDHINLKKGLKDMEALKERT